MIFRDLWRGGIAILTLAGPAPAWAEIPKLGIELDDLDLRLTLNAAVQSALIEENSDTEAEVQLDLSAQARADWRLSSDTKLGMKVEFSNDDRNSETLETGEIYGYLSSKFGRLEVGKQDGPADTLSFAAPVIALGQVRGDFSRYAGSQALLKPLDTRDSFKIIYLTPQIEGVSGGISWSPHFRRNADSPDLRSRVLVNNAIELGLQYEKPVGDWTLGVSGGYVTGNADPVTERADLNSWSVGAKMNRGSLRIGSAYVHRGNSKRRERDFDQWEWNGGIGWVEDRWGIVGSGAITRSSETRNFLLGVGGFYTLAPNLQLRSDIVRFHERRLGGDLDKGTVMLMELQLKI